jgi:hypothetical protein
VFDALDDGFKCFDRDGSLLECSLQTRAKFDLIERFTNPVLFHDAGHDQLRNFIGCEAFFAVETLSPSPNLIPLGDQPRVDHLGIYRSTKWTMHASSSFL